MTSQISLPNGYSVNSLIDVYSTKIDNNSESSDVNFQELLNSMLTTSTTLPGMDSSSSESTDLMPLLLLLFNQLLSQNISNSDSLFGGDKPQGTPLQGIITQDCHDGHTAIDFGVPVGTNVHSTMSGKIVHAGWNNEGYGNLVIVENGNFKTYYAHLSKIPVKVGQTVVDGEIIGLSGNTGNSTGPHLHYETRQNGIAIDPTTTLIINK